MQRERLRGLIIAGWNLLRKPTTPVHLAYGLLAVFIIWQFGILAGLAMMVLFMVWEWWNDRNEKMRKVAAGIPYVYEGDWDWWESSVSFCIGFFILGIFKMLGMVTVGWLP